MEKISVLNVGAGKLRRIPEFEEYFNGYRNYFMVNLDNTYLNGLSASNAEREHDKWFREGENITVNVNCDVFEFLERYLFTFSAILIYRFFEHIPRDKLLYFIYLLSTVTGSWSSIDLISPDYQQLAYMLLNEDPEKDPDFDKNDIILSTEIFNEPTDPHLNITTPDRIKRLFEYENRFKIEHNTTPYTFGGRNIYFRTLIERI